MSRISYNPVCGSPSCATARSRACSCTCSGRNHGRRKPAHKIALPRRRPDDLTPQEIAALAEGTAVEPLGDTDEPAP